MKKFQQQYPNYNTYSNDKFRMNILPVELLREISYKLSDFARIKIEKYKGPGRLNSDSVIKALSDIVSTYTNNEKTSHWGWSFIQKQLEQQMLDFANVKFHKFMDAIMEINDFLNAAEGFNEIFVDHDFGYKLTGDSENPWVTIEESENPIEESCDSVKCVLCSSEVNDVSSTRDFDRDIKSFVCPVCGKYSITEEALDELDTKAFLSEKAKFSALIREKTIQDVKILLCVDDEGISEQEVVSLKNVLKEYPSQIGQKIERVLKNLSSLSKFHGDAVSITYNDYPVFFPATYNNRIEEAIYLLKELIKLNFITGEAVIPRNIILTSEAWAKLEGESMAVQSKQDEITAADNKEDTVLEKVRPSIFIGSSLENLSVAYAIQSNLEHDSDPTVWTQGVFQLSSSAIRDLLKTLNAVDFAVFVFSPDDVTKIRKQEMQTVRDNVVFEMGMFIGGLGVERTFFVIPQDTEKMHLPTDLIGVEPGRYNSKRGDGNLKAALGPVCHEIIQKMKELGKK